jgi:hypothetical protein
MPWTEAQRAVEAKYGRKEYVPMFLDSDGYFVFNVSSSTVSAPSYIYRLRPSARYPQRWFDLVGVQRHLKVLGIFCRLWYRDGKAGYLPDLPRTLDYVRDTCARYDELGSLARFLGERVAAALPLANARERA